METTKVPISIATIFSANISEPDSTSESDETLAQVFSPINIPSIFPPPISEHDSTAVSDETLTQVFSPINRASIFPPPISEPDSTSISDETHPQVFSPINRASIFPPPISEPYSTSISNERLLQFCPSRQSIFPPRCDSISSRSFSIQSNGREDESYPKGQKEFILATKKGGEMPAEVTVSLVLQNLVPLLIQEVEVLKGVHKEVASFKAELEFIQYFLKDADAKAEMEGTNNVAKIWLKQVSKAASRIEDVIDQYILHSVKRGRRQKGIFQYFLQKGFHLPIKLKPRNDIASEIQDIKNTLNEIKQRGKRYGFIPLEQGGSSSDITWHDPRVTSHLIEEVELVGIESPSYELISWLVEGPSSRMVMSVVGSGGLGKTTLVKKVYGNEKVITNFDCHAWITVPRSYRMDELLRDMIKQFYTERQEFALTELDTMHEVELMVELKKFLRQKRYVVVFDDIWDIQFWRHIEHSLPDNCYSSRIIITTRNEDVAPSNKESSFYHVYKILPLSPEKAWELFCKKVFQTEGHNFSFELEELLRSIVNKCEGLPLAIVSIGGLLSTKYKLISEWRQFHDTLGLELETNPHLLSIIKVLSLSYHDLPFYLKSCFLYFGMFPEGYSINCKRLFKLWIAEGFVKEVQGLILEEIAEDYLNQLIHRSLVQVVEVDIFGKATLCRVLFCHASIKHHSSSDGIARRLSIQKNITTDLKRITSSETRSILIFEAGEFPKDLVTFFFTNYKLVKTLDFEDAPIDYIPKEVGDLFHLKYLSLRNTEVRILPKSIGKLHNLETLDLGNCLVYELPAEISGLYKLRHLEAYNVDYDKNISMDRLRAVKIQSGIGRLESLLTLLYVEANDHGLVEELGRLWHLRELGISKLKRQNGMALCTTLENMKSLKSLFVYSTNEEEYLELQSLSSPPPLLQSLYLAGRLEKLPEWISKLKYVVQIHLYWSRFLEDPIKVLQALPNLMEFVLYEGYDGEQLYFKKGGFQKLKKLWLQNLKGLKKLIIEEGALPLLEGLLIGTSSQMKELPTGIQHLKTLKTLEFYDMPKEFVLSMQPDGGRDFWKVEHIPAVHFNYMFQGEPYRFFKLRELELLEFLQGDS